MHGSRAFRTQIGRQAGEIVAQGGLVPDDLMLKVVTNRLDALYNRVRSTECLSLRRPLTRAIALDLRWFSSHSRTG